MSLIAVDQLISARWVVPVVPSNTVLEHHCIAMDQGRIVDILPTRKAYETYRASNVLERSHHVLLPGLVNAHAHSPMTLMRGMADDLPLKTWLEEHVWPIEAEFMGPEFVRAGTELAIAEMLRGGTTCVNEHYFFPDVSAHTFAAHHMRARIGLPIVDIPTAWAQTDDDYFARAAAVREEYATHPLLSFAYAPHAPYSVSDANFARIRSLNETDALPVHLHLLETAQEVEDSVAQYQMTPMERLQALGLLNEHLLAVHMTAASAEDIARCAAAGVTIVHCPESNLKLASGFCPVHAFHAAGVTIAIGTDGCASNNDLDMFGEMRTAALLAKAVAQRADAFSAVDALHAATLGGAQALALDTQIGSLEVGKQADLIAVDMARIEAQPLYNVISQLVYATAREQVSDAWVAGRHLLKYGELVHMDMDELKAQTLAWQERMTTR